MDIETLIDICRIGEAVERGIALQILDQHEISQAERSALATALATHASFDAAAGTDGKSALKHLLIELLLDDPYHARRVGQLVTPILERLLERETNLTKSPSIPQPVRDKLYWAGLTSGIISRSHVREMLSIVTYDDERERLLSYALGAAARDDPKIAKHCVPLPDAFTTELIVDGEIDLGLLRILSAVARVTVQQDAIAHSYGLLIQVLRTGEPEYEYTALRIVGEIQRDTPTDVFLDELIEQAQLRDDPRRRAALFALGQYASTDPESVVPVTQAFTNAVATGNERTKRTALIGLMPLVEANPRAIAAVVVPVLEESLLEDDATERTLATWLLIRFCSETESGEVGVVNHGDQAAASVD